MQASKLNLDVAQNISKRFEIWQKKTQSLYYFSKWITRLKNTEKIVMDEKLNKMKQFPQVMKE